MADPPLPSIVPVFPLSGVLLLPRAPLPLHIFEPRYRAMTRDSLTGEGYIAMVQPKGEGGDPQNPPIYDVACLGKIVASEGIDDGRFNIVLYGTSRLRIARELTLKDGYRRVEADYGAFESDRRAACSPIEREAVIAALKVYLDRRSMKANWEEAENASDEALVNGLAVACPFAPQEKQALLEAPTLSERACLLQALCEMDTGPSPVGGAAAMH